MIFYAKIKNFTIFVVQGIGTVDRHAVTKKGVNT